MTTSLYEKIGAQKIREVIKAFYIKAFQDPIIGYFFVNVNQNELIEKQTQFSIALLGGPKQFSGQSLKAAHAHLKIRPAHFGRRQMIMREILAGTDLPTEIQVQWLAAEEKLKPLIVYGDDCNH